MRWPDWRLYWARIVRTEPELDEGEKRYGATFVNILFGLVVTQAAVGLAVELVDSWTLGTDSLQETRVAHLLVAITLTVLSWIGYHQSQQYPPFLIKFINIPFFQFFLDVSMVVAYYMVVAVAENTDAGTGVAIAPSAWPETVLILAIFILYSAWDGLGYLLFRDPYYSSRLETPRDPVMEFGARRWVTIVFLGLMAVLTVLVGLWGPTTPGGVIAVDAAIITLLLAYRLSKQAFHPKVKIRQQA